MISNIGTQKNQIILKLLYQILSLQKSQTQLLNLKNISNGLGSREINLNLFSDKYLGNILNQRILAPDLLQEQNIQMRQAEAVISKANAFAQPLEINFQTDQRHGIYLPFFATLILFGIITAITISGMVDLFSYKKITITGYREIYQKQEAIIGSVPMIGFRMKIDKKFLTLTQFNEKFTSRFSISRQLDWTDYQFELEPCTRKHWASVSDEEYQKYNVSDFYCPATLEGFQIKSYQLNESLVFLHLQVTPINWQDYIDIHSGKLWRLQTLLFSQSVLEKQKVPYHSRLKSLLAKAQYVHTTMVKIQHLQTNVKTDYSFFPVFSSQVDQRMITVQRMTMQSTLVTTAAYNKMIHVVIQMGIKSLQYERDVGKITTVFAEAGGLYTAVFGVLSIVILVYYNHKLRLKLAENTFKKNKNSIQHSDYGFIKSLGYGASGFVKPDQNSGFAKECKRIERNLKQVNSLMHIEVILKRLQMLQGAFEYSSDRDEFACLSLLERSSLEKFQYKRIRIEYYDQIVRDRNAITIRDAREFNDGLGLTLEAFFHQKLQYQVYYSKEQKQERLKSRESIETNVRLETVNSMLTNSFNSQQQIMKAPQIGRLSVSKLDMNILQKVINQFKDLKAEAESIEISPDYAKIEVSLAKAFYKMDREKREMLQQKIPIIILHRLMKTIWQLKKKKRETLESLKKQNKVQAKNPEEKIKEEDEELSDWDIHQD